MKNRECWLILGLLVCLVTVCQAVERSLNVSKNGRYLTQPDGTPFFYLGDTAWELFHRLDRDEADRYLEDRAAKGFTVIQAVALAEEDGLNTPNSYGHRPLVDNDPARPDVRPGERNDYWDHVDYIVDKAQSLGMFVGMLPTWGDKWNLKWGVGPEVFSPENAEIYGRWLGSRYRDRPIIWILGGDRPVEDDRHREIINAMARGLRRGDGGAHLMTYHPCGGTNSADLFHDADWLDFNMTQSGHRRPCRPNYEFMQENLGRAPRKPTLDGEPCYEDHPVKGETWSRRNRPGVLLRWFDEWDVRVAAYQSMLAGACGHTYGDHNIWQMWLPGRPPKSVARTPWPAALDHPGSRQMKYLRGLFESRPFWKMQADQSLVSGENPAGPDHVRAARAADGAYAVIYLPTGKPVTVDLDRLSGDSINAWWFNPRQNSSQLIGEFKRTPQRTFTPPSTGRNNDWVLAIDDSAKDLPRLGYSHQNIVPAVKE
jgi:hypothetical protein